MTEIARRAKKSNNTYGDPIVLGSKLLAVVADPNKSGHVFVAESAALVRSVNVVVSAV